MPTPPDPLRADREITAPAPGQTHQLHLRAGGTSLLLDVTDGRIPEVAHWGHDLGDLSATDLAASARAARVTGANNDVDVPVRVGIIPQASDGWLGRPGLQGSRADGSGAWPRLAVQGIRHDGDPLEEAVLQAGPGLLEIDLADEALGLEVRLEIQMLASGLLRMRGTITNRATEPYHLHELTLSLGIPDVAEEVLDFAGRWGKERTPQRGTLGVGAHVRENRRGRTGADSAHLLHVGTPGFGFREGEIWAVHTGFSGNHRHVAERVSTGRQVIGGGELLLPGEAQLGTDQTYAGPWVYAAHGTGLDAIAHRFHAHLRSRPQHVSTDRPVTLNVWEAVYFDHDLARLKDLADRAASLGVERFVLDDGWFGSRRDDSSGLGDWVESADVWPEGLGPIIDHVTGLGMQFGLWFEPEMVNEDSDVARAHPEWIMAPSTHRIPLESRRQQVLNLSLPGAYEHVRSQMQAILNRYDIAYIKWDHNRDLIESADRSTGIPAVHAQTLATYHLMDELKAAHPGLEIESCSSGGARVDLGILERTDRVWVSDCIDPLDRQQMNRWTSQLLPYELMGSHIASGHNHTTGRLHDLSFRAGTALFGHLGIEWDLTQATEAENADLAEWIVLYRRVRELLFTGDLVRMDRRGESTWLYGVVSPTRDRALFTLASLSPRSGESQSGRLRFAGLDPERRYLVEVIRIGDRPTGYTPTDWALGAESGEEILLSGSFLMQAGLACPALAPEQTLLLELTAHPSTDQAPTGRNRM